MLSRIAESMFWIGRYVERAEDTARLLQTHLRLLVEDTSAAEVDACRNLLALMNVDHVEEPDPRRPAAGARLRPARADLDLLLLGRGPGQRPPGPRGDPARPLGVRSTPPGTSCPSAPFGVAGAHTFLNWARERSALFAGIARGIMVRDDGWQFMSMGRSLEQVDMTSRMVASASLTAGSTQWPAVLRGCGGHDAFLRTYRGLHSDREAAEFLILDARFPRSIMHGLVAAADSLREGAQHNMLAARQSELAVRALGQLRARLEYAEIDDLLRTSTPRWPRCRTWPPR